MARTLEPDDQIAHYRIVGPLGAGGMGEVYIARDETLERSVALKILPPALVRSDERVRRFVLEAKSASSLNHPNIVTIYEIGRDQVRAAKSGGNVDPEAEPIHYISMELVAGDSLDVKIHRERADLRSLVGWLAQAAEGIAKAHASGIVHRDLKPGNIMVSQDGFAKVLDFGLAKLTERVEVSEADRPHHGAGAGRRRGGRGAGTVMGTVGYMSPEQVQARPVDHRSDIFSLGCILYEAAARRRPFSADSDIETLHRILKDHPAPVEQINPEVPGEIRRVIRRCLAKAPDQRFQSMKDLAIDLREMVESWESLTPSTPSGVTGRISGSGPAPAVAAPRSGAGRLLAMAAAILIGLGGVGFGLYALLQRGGPGGNAPAVSLQDLSLSILMSRPDLMRSEAGAMALSGDGRYLAFVTQQDVTTSLVVRQVRTGSEVVVVAASRTPVHDVAFSRDGDFLYFLNRDADSPNYNALYQVASLGGTPRRIFFDVDSAPTFSPDGKEVCFRRGLLQTGADSLQIGNLETGATRELFQIKSPESFSTAPDWSHDGRSILVGIESRAGGIRTRLQVIDAATGSNAPIPGRDWIRVTSARYMRDGRAVLATALDRSTGAYQVFRIGLPGGDTLRLTNDFDGYSDLSVATDGTSVAALRTVEVNNLWLADGRKRWDTRAITFATGSAAAVQQVSALPDDAVAFSAPDGNIVRLYRMRADGSDRRALNTTGVFIIRAVYGQRMGLLFSQVDAAEQINTHIWRVDPDGSGLRQLTEGGGEEIFDTNPRGDALLFRRWESPQSLYSLRAGETTPRLITENHTGGGPDLSNDGTKVLYVTVELEGDRFTQRVHVAPIDGGADFTSFRLPQGGVGPAWARDDDAEITYIDLQGGRNNLMRMKPPDGPPRPIARVTEGAHTGYAQSADGRHLTYVQRVGGEQRLFVLTSGESKPTLVTEFKTGMIRSLTWAPDAPVLYFAYSTASSDIVMMGGVR